MWRISLLTFLFVSVVSANYNGNYALSFDGVDDIVTVPTTYQDYSLSDFWTLEAWIWPAPDQPSSHQLNIIAFPSRHPSMNYCSQNNPQCPPGSPLVQLRTSTGAWFPIIGNNTRATPSQWHHVAGTWNNQTLRIYVDGILDVAINPYSLGYTEGVNCANRACDLGFQIGGYYFKYDGGAFSTSYFHGYIDEVRVWTSGRTQHEIQTNMNTVLTGREPGLLYYFRFDDPGSSSTRSEAFNLYALLGGGFPSAEPAFIKSTSPLTGPDVVATGFTPRGPEIVEVGKDGGVTAGALIGVFALLIGAGVGIFVGWKSYRKQLFTYFWNDGGNAQAARGESAPLVSGSS